MGSGQLATIDFEYSPNGNLTSKSDYANSYLYVANQVQQITLDNGDHRHYQYNANGNMVRAYDTGGIGGNADRKLLKFDAFKPTRIQNSGLDQNLEDNAHVLEFSYGSNEQRFYQLKGDAPGQGSGYVGDEYKIYIDKMMEITGDLVETAGRGFDPFGKPREDDWSDSDHRNNGLNDQGDTANIPGDLNRDDLNRDDLTTRGFTGHEHLNETDLIHMNGRVYDYNLGRFYSVDPFIQFPENSQSVNGYSYILNNPLSGTDPSGYMSCGDGTSCTKAAEGLGAGESLTVKATSTGSRISRTVGTVTKGADGSFTVTASNGASSSASAGDGMTNSEEKLSPESRTPQLNADNAKEEQSGDSGGNAKLGFISDTFVNSKSFLTPKSKPGPAAKSFSCQAPMNCIDQANQFFDEINAMAGTVNQSGFKTQTEANLAAAKAYLEPTLLTQREANWITFQDPVTKEWGFTLPAVGLKGQEITKGAKFVRVGFDAAYGGLLRPRSLGHTHFENNSFSGTDIQNFVGKNPLLILANPVGDVTYLNRRILREKYGLSGSNAIKSFLKDFTGSVQDTGVSGIHIGNIYNE